jgi:hypothetical protein
MNNKGARFKACGTLDEELLRPEITLLDVTFLTRSNEYRYIPIFPREKNICLLESCLKIGAPDPCIFKLFTTSNFFLVIS